MASVWEPAAAAQARRRAVRFQRHIWATPKAKKEQETPELWHARFGHLGYRNMAKLPEMVNGIKQSKEVLEGCESAALPPAKKQSLGWGAKKQPLG